MKLLLQKTFQINTKFIFNLETEADSTETPPETDPVVKNQPKSAAVELWHLLKENGGSRMAVARVLNSRSGNTKHNSSGYEIPKLFQ